MEAAEAAEEQETPTTDDYAAQLIAEREGAQSGGDTESAEEVEGSGAEAEGITDNDGGEEVAAEAEGQPEGESDPLDWDTFVERREDGKLVLRADKLPDEVLFGYGDTEDDLFDRDDFDHRRSRYNQRMTEADKWIKERERHYTPDGKSKGDLWDGFHERFESEPAEFLSELAESVPDKVQFAYSVLAKYAPEFANAVYPAFNELVQSGQYNPAEFQAQHLENKVKTLEERYQQEAQQRQIAENRAKFHNTVAELAGGQLTPDDHQEVERIFVEMHSLHSQLGEAYPDKYPQPTPQMAYDHFVKSRQSGQPQAEPDPVEEVIQEATKDEPKKPPRHATGGGGGSTEKPQTSDDLAAKLIAQRNQK